MIYYNALNVMRKAYILLGHSKVPLTAVDTEDTDPNNRAAAELYESALNSVLAEHPWNFLRAEYEVVSAPFKPGKFLTDIPPDCLRVLSARDMAGEDASYRITEEGVISDEPLSELCYLRMNDDPDSWPPWVRNVLVTRLAADLARLIDGSMIEVDLRETLYSRSLQKAKDINSQEERGQRRITGARDIMGLGHRRHRRH